MPFEWNASIVKIPLKKSYINKLCKSLLQELCQSTEFIPSTVQLNREDGKVLVFRLGQKFQHNKLYALFQKFPKAIPEEKKNQ